VSVADELHSPLNDGQGVAVIAAANDGGEVGLDHLAQGGGAASGGQDDLLRPGRATYPGAPRPKAGRTPVLHESPGGISGLNEH
jgi:hypothetical protein